MVIALVVLQIMVMALVVLQIMVGEAQTEERLLGYPLLTPEENISIQVSASRINK
jgi:hypothetical protein